MKPATMAASSRTPAPTSSTTASKRTRRCSPGSTPSVMARTIAGGTNVPVVHPSVDRVVTALRAGGVDAEVREFSESTRTAIDAANALGVPVGAIVKSLVFAADAAPLLVLASGDHQVDTAKVAHVIGATHVGRADADLVRDATGFAIGGGGAGGAAAPPPAPPETPPASFDAPFAPAR